MAEFVFSATHDLYYSTKEPVPIGEVIESLLGLERLVKMAPRALEGLTGVPIDRIEVYVDQLESGSLLEKVVLKLFFKDEQEFEAFFEKVRAKVGNGVARNVLIGAVVSALLLYGVYLLASSSGGNTTNITANNNTIINIGAGEVQLTPEQFKSIVQAAVTDKKELAQAASQIVRPLRRDASAALVIDGNDSLKVTPAVVKETPDSFKVVPDTKVEVMRDVELHVRTTNRDSNRTGWSARLPLKFDHKLKLKLEDHLDPEDIAGKPIIKGDVEIHYVRDAQRNQYAADYITLLNIKE